MKKEGIWHVPDRYEILAGSYERWAWEIGEESASGPVIGVLRALHDYEMHRDPDELVADIWRRLAHKEGIDFDDLDESSEPGGTEGSVGLQ